MLCAHCRFPLSDRPYADHALARCVKSPVMWSGRYIQYAGKTVGMVDGENSAINEVDPYELVLLIEQRTEGGGVITTKERIPLTGWASVAIPQAQRIVEDRMGWKRPNGELPPTVPM